MKLYPFPKPKLHLTLRSTSKGRPEVYWDHRTHTIRWMGRNALRRLREFELAGTSFPTVDELQAWVIDHADKARDHFDGGQIEKMAEDAAVFALVNYDPEVYAAYQRRGRASAAKRRPRKRIFTMQDLEGLEHLSKAEQAEKLGCSTGTIATLRRELAIAADKDAALLAQLESENENSTPVERPAPTPSDFDYLLDPDAPTMPQETPQAPVINILTRRPVDPIRDAIEQNEREIQERLYAEMDSFLVGVAL